MTMGDVAMATVHAPASGPAQPVTPGEAAAIARRIRVEARLPRVTAVGTAMGLVCGAAAVWPFLDSRGYMAETLAGGDEFGVLSFVPGWLLAGLLPLLAFYAGRLHFQTGRSSTGEIEAGLRKVRRIILGSMLASAAAFVLVLASRPRHQHDHDPGPWLPLLYAACFVGCAEIVRHVRRGLGDFDSEHQRRRRRLARGFAVQIGPAGSAPAPPPDDIPLATAVSRPPVLPARAVAAAADDDDDDVKDLTLLVTLAVFVAVALHAVRLGETLPHAARATEQVVLAMQHLLGAQTFPPGVNRTDTLAGIVFLFALLARVLLVPCGVLWIVWGIVALNYGPALRRAVGWLTVVTIGLAATASVPPFVYGRDVEENRYANRLAMAPEVIHCLFLGVLLKRPAARRIFSRADDVDDPAGG